MGLRPHPARIRGEHAPLACRCSRARADRLRLDPGRHLCGGASTASYTPYTRQLLGCRYSLHDFGAQDGDAHAGGRGRLAAHRHGRPRSFPIQVILEQSTCWCSAPAPTRSTTAPRASHWRRPSASRAGRASRTCSRRCCWPRPKAARLTPTTSACDLQSPSPATSTTSTIARFRRQRATTRPLRPGRRRLGPLVDRVQGRNQMDRWHRALHRNGVSDESAATCSWPCQDREPQRRLPRVRWCATTRTSRSSRSTTGASSGPLQDQQKLYVFDADKLAAGTDNDPFLGQYDDDTFADSSRTTPVTYSGDGGPATSWARTATTCVYAFIDPPDPPRR